MFTREATPADLEGASCLRSQGKNTMHYIATSTFVEHAN
jgi:hypothetical protein